MPAREEMEERMEPEFSSPVCFAAQADGVYMGYAGRDELVCIIPSLIDTEHALAVLASGSAQPMLDTIRTDAEHGCAMLADALQRLGGAGHVPLPDIASNEPAEPWRELHHRLGTILALLHALIPRIRDERFRDQLAGLRDRHVRSKGALDQRIGPSA